MFLKRIEIQGFKSFADRIAIDFESPFTGVVGPNGCGKSNIVDAIRWVLGEQSIKSLRGEKMTDIIFAGSADRKAQNMAEVTLAFDNHEHYLNTESDEVEITRRIYNTEQDAEYLINRQQVRLKDVIDLILDTGLGKDSLSIISQGNIQSFAEARPYERRGIFEDAAGVSKYKKRKTESLSRLERTKLNLDRTYDILQELERQVIPLERQAKKAIKYRENKKRLTEIEVAVLVDDIAYYQKAKAEIEEKIAICENNVTLSEGTVQIQENAMADDKSRLHELDKEIADLQDRHFKVVNEIQSLEKRKVEFDEKRKYLIESGSDDDKINALNELIASSKLEYEDRLNRLDKLNNELSLISNELEDTAFALSDATLKKEEAAANLRRLENRLDLLTNLLKDPFSSRSQAGVGAIMQNKESLNGILGVVGQELHPLPNYASALSVALGGAMYNIVTEDEKAAREAIAFLRKNQSGRATFLPLTVLKARSVAADHLLICKHSEGYLGTMADFVSSDDTFKMVSMSLLANVLVTENLESANKLARLLNYNYKIVTLDGDVVHRGGSMTGGKNKNESSLITANQEKSDIEKQLLSVKAQAEIEAKNYARLGGKKSRLEGELTAKRIAIAQLEPVVEAKKAKYLKLENDLAALNPQKEGDNITENAALKKLSSAYALRDDLANALKNKKELRLRLSNEVDRNDQQMRQLRSKLSEANKSLRSLSSDNATLNAKLEYDLKRLADTYEMTYEYAKDHYHMDIDEELKNEVKVLRNSLQNMGSVNMNAPEEYAEVKERYDFTKKNYDDLIASRDKILKAIEEMDVIMKKQFLDTFNKINIELNDTFKALFGGGKAKLVLEDENDILNTGIDIDVQPPGKAVKSIRLFSGGEKTLIAICVLFTILKIRPVPLIVFDEVEAALDQANVERFAKYIKTLSKQSQFIIITHRPGTMAQCDVLYGVTMQKRGVSQMLKVKLVEAISMAEKEEGNELS